MIKIKPPKTFYKDGKIVKYSRYYRAYDDFGDLLRKSEFPFPNSKPVKDLEVVIDLDKVERALF
jgi:hypothetical protein